MTDSNLEIELERICGSGISSIRRLCEGPATQPISTVLRTNIQGNCVYLAETGLAVHDIIFLLSEDCKEISDYFLIEAFLIDVPDEAAAFKALIEDDNITFEDIRTFYNLYQSFCV